MSAALQIGDTSRDGLIQVTDTSWDGNGTMRVTVREMIGDHCGGWTREQMIRKMRDTAKRAVPMPQLTTGAALVRVWHAQGTDHATFAVTRLPR